MSPTSARVFISVVVGVAATASGCAGVQGRARSLAAVEDCSRHLHAAHAALAEPPEAGLPAAHVHAMAMHDYHTCLANAHAVAPVRARR